MSIRYRNAWDVIFFDTDRMRTALPRRARFNSDEALIKFARGVGLLHDTVATSLAGGCGYRKSANAAGAVDNAGRNSTWSSFACCVVSKHLDIA
jgi:hypothetical protein